MWFSILPSLQSPKSAIFTYPSVSRSRLSSFKSLQINKGKKRIFAADITWRSTDVGLNEKTETAYLYTILWSCKNCNPKTTQAA